MSESAREAAVGGWPGTAGFGTTVREPTATRTDLPALRRADTPRIVYRVARLTLATLAMAPLALLLVPWTQSVRGSGSVLAYAPEDRQQVVEAPIAGRVTRWHVREGDRVEAGDELLEIADNDPLLLERLRDQRVAGQARLDAALARVEANEHQVEALVDSQALALEIATQKTRVAADKVEASRQALLAAEAGQRTAALDLARQEGLLKEGIASMRTLELARLADEQARTGVERARAQLRGDERELEAQRVDRDRTAADLRARVGAAKASRDTARADLATATGQLLELDSRLARQETQLVTAPVAGTILRIERAGVYGEQVSQGERLLVIVPERASLAVELSVDGNDVALIDPGRKVRVQIEGWPAVQFAGWPSVAVGSFGGIVQVVDAAVDVKGRFRVIVAPDPAEPPWPGPRHLRQGLRAEGFVLLDQVSLGYELWRRVNGFPPVVDAKEGEPGGGKAQKLPKPKGKP